jgi:hypothetical protein
VKKAELVDALNRYADEDESTMRGQTTLARFLAYYFGELEVPADQRWDFWRIEPHIPQLLLGAFEEFRNSQVEAVRQLREQYERETAHSFPDLTDVWGNGVVQVLAVQALGFLLRDVTGADWLESQISAVFNAQRHLLEQEFYKFLHRVLRQGLFEIINACPQRGMSGTFGPTTLRSYVIAGRLMLTFARPGEDQEQSISFVCTDDDPLGLGGGVQSVYTDIHTAMSMLADVMAAWPSDRPAQVQVFQSDPTVSLGF